MPKEYAVITLVNYATLYVRVYLVPRCKAETVKMIRETLWVSIECSSYSNYGGGGGRIQMTTKMLI